MATDPKNPAAPALAASAPADAPAAEDTHQLIQVRLDKAEKIRAAGFDPYANDFRPEVTAAELHARYGDVDAATLDKVNTVHTVAGRVIMMRQMGKASFLVLRDASPREIQIYVKQDRVGESAYGMLKLMDLGDIIGVAGTPMRTKTGELSIAADGLRVLTKSVRPLPSQHFGLADVEQRYRHRYVDLVVNPQVRQVFRDRSRVIRGIQKFLDERGFIEVETPVLQDQAGGASAKPFITHHNTLDMQLYLRIATELHLKRLVVGGLERVYEIGRIFRNEGVSTKHNPEFTSIEVYQAYATYHDMMELTESVISGLAQELRGSNKIPYGDRVVDVSRPWRQAPIARLVQEHLKIEENLEDIDSVERAMSIVAGHTATPDEPMHICLKELSDDEAERIIPGMKPGAGSLVERAKAAFKGGADSKEWLRWLGRSIDDAFASGGAGGDDGLNDDVTVPRIRSMTAIEPPPATTKSGNPALDEDTGEIARPRRAADPMRARRRNIALTLLYAVFDHEVEKTITNPTFITDFPLAVSPLARKRDGDPAVTDRFELILAGMELANAFSELNDPIDQRARFAAQMRDKERGDVEANELDEDFCRALEIGMPPTAGLGIGIDRLVMVLTNMTSIRDVVLFPQMRKVSST